MPLEYTGNTLYHAVHGDVDRIQLFDNPLEAIEDYMKYYSNAADYDDYKHLGLEDRMLFFDLLGRSRTPHRQEGSISQPMVQQVIRSYPKELWKYLGVSPMLIGMNPNVIRKVMGDFVELLEESKHEGYLLEGKERFVGEYDVINAEIERYVEMRLRSVGKLLLLAGGKENNIVQIVNKLKKWYGEKWVDKLYEFSNSIPNFAQTSDYKFLLAFFLNDENRKNKGPFGMIVNNWNFLDDAIKQKGNFEDLYKNFKDHIKERTGINPQNEEFFDEFLMHEVWPDRYKWLEQLYLYAKDKPLPWFAPVREDGNVPVVFKNEEYRGYFVPKSDPKIMFIGSLVYLNSCQKIG